MVMVSAPILIFQWFEESELGSAMGVYGLNMPVATIAAFNAVGFVSQKVGWRASLLLATAMNGSALLCCALLIKEKKTSQPMALDGSHPI